MLVVRIVIHGWMLNSSVHIAWLERNIKDVLCLREYFTHMTTLLSVTTGGNCTICAICIKNEGKKKKKVQKLLLQLK
jgi:hypothetical protein